MITVTKVDLPEINEYIKFLKRIWETRMITNNAEFVQLLEKELQSHLNVKNLLLVTNGTLALQLPLKGLEIKKEVITTPFTFAASTNVLLWEGLKPVFADINPVTFNMNPDDVEKKITDNTSAILAVHVYGNPCYVERLEKIAKSYNLKLIFDGAQSFGVEYKNQSVLNYGDVSTISFHATKVYSTIEGGAIVVKDDELFEKMKLLRNFGFISEEKIKIPGINAKMNEFQAAMGLCNLTKVEKNIQLRKKLYLHYKENLEDVTFQEIIASKYNYCYMPVCFDSKETRDLIYNELKKQGIHPRKYFFPLTVSFDFFKNKRYSIEELDLKTAFDISNRVLCLPLYPDLEDSSVDKIINIVNNFQTK